METIDILNKLLDSEVSWLKDTNGESLMAYKHRSPQIVCVDLTTLSAQTGENLYCTPRDNIGPWTHVEVGYPSKSPPDSWAEYFDGDWEKDDRTNCVYGYVPIELVVEFIDSCKGCKTFEVLEHII